MDAPVIPPKPSDRKLYQNIRHYDIAHTLDNSVILDQQLETLNHHKKMLEAKKMKELLRQNPPSEPPSANPLIYSNIYHQKQQHHQQQQMVYGLQQMGSNDREDEDDDELPPPPSPVSSSYSELTRTINHPPNQQHHSNHHQPSGGYSEVQKKVQMIQNQMMYNNVKYPVSNHQGTGGDHNAAGGGNPNYAYHMIPPNLSIPIHQNPSSLSSNYSNYESIYEPIRAPPPQHQHQSHHSMYPTASYHHHPPAGEGFMSPYNSSAASSIYSQYGVKTNNGVKEQEVDVLTDMLVRSLHTNDPTGMCSVAPNSDYDQIQGDLGGENFGICVKCSQRIIGENSGCTAMDQVYHIECFTCCVCQINLQGKPFYPIDNQPFCQEDYTENYLEKCSVCVKPILERILRATGKPYHPSCFCCIVCGKSLDGIPFTVDATNQIHCIEDFHKKFAPRCCVCRLPIMPEQGKEDSETTVRVVALDRSFHISCYKCEDCGLMLSSEAEGRGCYPLDDHVLCKSCNANTINKKINMTTEL